MGRGLFRKAYGNQCRLSIMQQQPIRGQEFIPIGCLHCLWLSFCWGVNAASKAQSLLSVVGFLGGRQRMGGFPPPFVHYNAVPPRPCWVSGSRKGRVFVHTRIMALESCYTTLFILCKKTNSFVQSSGRSKLIVSSTCISWRFLIVREAKWYRGQGQLGSGLTCSNP